MKYFVTDQFNGSSGWTADKLAAALKEPLAQIARSKSGKWRGRMVRSVCRERYIGKNT